MRTGPVGRPHIERQTFGFVGRLDAHARHKSGKRAVRVLRRGRTEGRGVTRRIEAHNLRRSESFGAGVPNAQAGRGHGSMLRSDEMHGEPVQSGQTCVRAAYLSYLAGRSSTMSPT